MITSKTGSWGKGCRGLNVGLIQFMDLKGCVLGEKGLGNGDGKS